MVREGGCLCGAVRFKAVGEPVNVRICHCRNCQKAMGSPFFARALFDQKALTVEGETARYPSSEALDRVFCKTCGTRLFAWRTDGGRAGVALAAFDDRNAFAPTEHSWVTEKMDWVKLDDGLPQYPGLVTSDAVLTRYVVACSISRQPQSGSSIARTPLLYTVSVWVLPLVIAITFHEAAHGFVAHHFGDNTAWELGRVSFNPLKHIDPFGTLLLPAILLLSQSPFLFGYAKPVPVNFRALRNPRIDMVWVALAGPATNIVLALLAALAFHAVGYVPANAAQWIADNLKNALVINVVLAIFNMLPIPPLDGGRVAVGLLPNVLAVPLSRLEPYGMLILIGFLIILPMVGTQFGLNLDVISAILRTSTGYVIQLILLLSGNV